MAIPGSLIRWLPCRLSRAPTPRSKVVWGSSRMRFVTPFTGASSSSHSRRRSGGAPGALCQYDAIACSSASFAAEPLMESGSMALGFLVSFVTEIPSPVGTWSLAATGRNLRNHCLEVRHADLEVGSPVAVGVAGDSQRCGASIATLLAMPISSKWDGRSVLSMSANGMVRPCSCPASDRSWQGAPKTRSTPCPRQLISCNRRSRHRYRQELVPRCWP